MVHLIGATYSYVVYTWIMWSVASPELFKARRARFHADDHERLEQALDNIRYLVSTNSVVAFGTDNPPPLGTDDLMTEVRTLSRVLTPAEIIRSMTEHAAEFLGRSDELGTLAPGKLADLVRARRPRARPRARDRGPRHPPGPRRGRSSRPPSRS